MGGGGDARGGGGTLSGGDACGGGGALGSGGAQGIDGALSGGGARGGGGALGNGGARGGGGALGTGGGDVGEIDGFESGARRQSWPVFARAVSGEVGIGTHRAALSAPCRRKVQLDAATTDLHGASVGCRSGWGSW